MKRVSTVELMRNFGAFSDDALSTPIVVTKNGRDRLVIISIEQYDLLKHASDALEDLRDKPARPSGVTPRKG